MNTIKTATSRSSLYDLGATPRAEVLSESCEGDALWEGDAHILDPSVAGVGAHGQDSGWAGMGGAGEGRGRFQGGEAGQIPLIWRVQSHIVRREWQVSG